MSKEKWNAENIPDQTETVVIVTGSSSGIGYEAARVLANKNAEVTIAVRSREKGEAAVDKIRGQKKDAKVELMLLDLADLASIRSFSDEFKRKYSRLDRLINNAGVMIPPYGKTKDGFELQFGTNHLGHFALTAQLIGILTATAGSRIVNVSSGAHKAGKIDFNDLTWEKRGYSSWRAYGMSKIANLYFTYELNRRLKASGPDSIANAAHPGYTATELQRTMPLAVLANALFAQDISMGALPTLRAAYDIDSKGGDYYGPNGFMEMRGSPVKVDSNELSKDKVIAEKLWQVSEDLTGAKFDLGERSYSAKQR
ncbi:MAG: oxidoreductase [Acidobacteriota bacterium]